MDSSNNHRNFSTNTNKMDEMNDLMNKMMGGMMAMHGIGGSNLTMCMEGNWINHPIGELFRAVKGHDVSEVKRLLMHDKTYKHGAVNEVDGDGGGVLHILALDQTVSEGDASCIVESLKEAGADVNLRAVGMMSSETPLHTAACYGNYAVIKALIDAGAKADISDDYGRTPLSRIKKLVVPSPAASGRSNNKNDNIQKSLDLLQQAVLKGKQGTSSPSASTLSSSNNNTTCTTTDGRKERADELRLLGNKYYNEHKWEQAMEYYRMSIQCNDLDHRTHGNLAAAALEDAVSRLTSPNGKGYRGLFKLTYEEASKSVQLDPTYEKGWYRMARGYLGYRELPRAKQAARNGLQHVVPHSKQLQEIWNVLEDVGVPDQVVDHKSIEFQTIYQRLYIDHWIGDIRCDFCELLCMSHATTGSSPNKQHCPFCGCPTAIELGDVNKDRIRCLIVGGGGGAASATTAGQSLSNHSTSNKTLSSLSSSCSRSTKTKGRNKRRIVHAKRPSSSTSNNKSNEEIKSASSSFPIFLD